VQDLEGTGTIHKMEPIPAFDETKEKLEQSWEFSLPN